VKTKDDERDRVLSENGFKEVWFWGNDVLQNLEDVLEAIREK
jgi:very-short-patch-repair endonuclease